VAKIGEVAYKLQLPETSRIHPVFHVSLLKKAVGDYHNQGDLPKDLEVEEANDVYPEQVVGTRVTVKEGMRVHQSLIKWQGKTLDDVTWEDDDFVRSQFPEFSLEDKAWIKLLWALVVSPNLVCGRFTPVRKEKGILVMTWPCESVP
jgi:hypothetical protein